MRGAITLLRGADRVITPWKNGQGSTSEIARHPPGKEFTTFDWRLSCASFDRDSDFSLFAGIDRVLVVLTGAMRLEVENRTPVHLDASSEPFAFSGDSHVRAHVLQAPVIDLNVMTLRGRTRAIVQRLAIRSDVSIDMQGDPSLLYVVSGSLSARFRDRSVELAANDCLLVPSSESTDFSAATLGATVVWVSIEQL